MNDFQKLDSNGHFNKIQINNQLISIENSLNTDLNNTDIRMQNIQSYIADLGTQIVQLKTMAANEKDPYKRSNLYKVINSTLEICATFEGLYLKALEVKFKFRQEFINAVHKKIKLFEIELDQLETGGELNKVELVKMMNQLQKSFDKYHNVAISNKDNNVNEENELSDAEIQMKKTIENLDKNNKYNLR